MLQQFEIDEDTRISEVTFTYIMARMGFVQESNNADLEAIRTIWHHLNPVGGQPNDEDEAEDNGETVVVAHCRIFMGAILGFNLGPVAHASSPDPSVIGQIDEETGTYILSNAEVSKVHKRYK